MKCARGKDKLKIAKLKKPYVTGNKVSKFVVYYGKTATGAFHAVNTYETKGKALRFVKSMRGCI